MNKREIFFPKQMSIYGANLTRNLKMGKMSQEDSVNTFTMEIFLHGNFTVSLEGKKLTLMENICVYIYIFFFSLQRIEHSVCHNEIHQELLPLASRLAFASA